MGRAGTTGIRAPELDLTGALGAPVGDFRAAIRTADGTAIGVALIPVALVGMVHGSPAFAAALEAYLTPAGKQKFADAMNHCTPQNLMNNIGFQADAYLNASIEEVFADPVISAAIDEGQLGARPPATRVYVYKAIDDEISTVASV